MAGIDPTIKKETGFIAMATLILSALLEAVFLVIGRWDITVLFGNLLGAGVGILNFFLMGLGLQKALDKDEKDAKATVVFSHTARFFLMAVVIMLAVLLSCFNAVSAILSLLFPTVGVYMRTVSMKNKKEESA